MRVSVSRKDILEGQVLDPANCAVALAIRKMGFGLAYVAQDTATVQLRPGQPVLQYRVPKDAGDWVTRFDMFGKSKLLCRVFARPFSFDMEPIGVVG